MKRPVRSRSIVEMLDGGNAGGDAVRVAFGDVEHTRASLRDVATNVAAGLQVMGLERRDRVAVLSAGRMEVIELFFGTGQAGGINVVLNSFLKGDMLVHQLRLTSPRFLLVDPSGLTAYAAIAGELEVEPELILLDTTDEDVDGVAHHSWDDVRSAAATPEPVPVDPDDPASIVFTSGTTGRSKGCTLSHRYFVECGRRIVEQVPLEVGEVQYTTYPLFHIGGQCSSLGHSLLSGASIAYDAQFRASTFWDRVREVGATYSQATGAIGMALLAQPSSDRDRDHPLRRASWIPMAREAQTAFAERFGVTITSNFYGQTEFSPVCIDPSGRAQGTMGFPLPDVEVRVADPDGEPVEPGRAGELLVRPRRPGIMFSGYWAEPERTLAAWRDLWYHTGDITVEEPDGSLRFIDRLSDAVRRAGENVSCFEVEQVLLRLPGVARAAVHALPSELIEDEIKVWLVLEDGIELTPDEVFEHCASRLPYFAIPRYLELTADLPTNAMGKVQKSTLRDIGSTSDQLDLKELGLVLSRDQRR